MKTIDHDDKPISLKMTWPLGQKAQQIHLAEHFSIRQFQLKDKDIYLSLLKRCPDLKPWTMQEFEVLLQNKLSPSGIFLAFHDKKPVATACGQDESRSTARKSAELGWVAVDTEYRRQKLGKAVTIAALQHLIDLEYQDIFLMTDNNRPVAIKLYLSLGFKPDLQT